MKVEHHTINIDGFPLLLAIYFIGVGLGWWQFDWLSAIGMGILEIFF